MKNDKELMEIAEKARENSYSPYSGFAVGSALLAESGKIYTGVNIENSSYPAGICAERSAFSSAVSAGERKFSAIAISGSSGDFCFPCGICRQFMSELCDENFKIILKNSSGEIKTFTLGALLPHSFSLNCGQ